MLGTLVVGTAVVSVVIGFLFGAGISRSLSVGWYVVGCALLASGFFVGWASPDEQRESISLSALLIAVGFLVIVLGAIADSRHALV